jgi:hypothetical protein
VLAYRERVHDVYCRDDGRRRVVIVTGRAGPQGYPARITVYSMGARVAVSGRLTRQGGEWVFRAVGRNAALLGP